MADGRQHVAAQHRKILQPERRRLPDRHRRRRRRRLEADGEENHLLVRVLLRQHDGVGARIDHADVAAPRPRLEQRQAVRSGHAQAVAVGAQHDAFVQRQADGLVDAPDRQHADRAARAVDHPHVVRQQVGDAVARNRVRVTAAEFHEMVAARRIRLAPDGGGEFPGRIAVAEFVDVLHQWTLGTSFASSSAANSASVLAASSGSRRLSA